MTKKTKTILGKTTDDSDADSGSQTGSSSGEIKFKYKDPLLGPVRDDLLAPAEMQRLLKVHKEVHKQRVDKQKVTLESRVILKSGQPNYKNQHLGNAGYGFAAGSKYKSHPISQKVQFSGIDKQVTALPNELEANTNEDLQQELENKHELKHQFIPQFHPKPKFPG